MHDLLLHGRSQIPVKIKQFQNFFKFWWDEELTRLKEFSISTYRLWNNCGKPRSGEIFRKMFQAKHEYKNALKAKEKDRQEYF